MIPVPVTATLDAVPGEAHRPGQSATRAGIGVLAVALLAALVWTFAVSPLSFPRADGVSGEITLDLEKGERVFVAAEGDGFAGLELPPPVTVSVLGSGGFQVRVEQLATPGQPLLTDAYDLFGREGRVIAEFRAPSDQKYVVKVSPIGATADRDLYSDALPSGFAVAPGRSLSWWGSATGLAVLVAPLVVLGVGLIVTGTRTRRRARRAGTAG